MTQFALGIEYDGSPYKGWQAQAQQPSVQANLEAALSQVAATSINVICAGRTDAGVHALGQVIHFATQAKRQTKNWLLGANSLLPASISVRWAREVTDDFHARFSASARRYLYVIDNRPERPALLSSHVVWMPYRLELAAMQQAAQYLLGENDFTSFRSSSCQSKTPMRCVDFINIHQQGPYIVIDIKANAFLHHMVRNIAGVLMSIGRGEKPAVWAQQVLQARDRTKASVTAPSQGLYLYQVDYPSKFSLPQTQTAPFSLELNLGL